MAARRLRLASALLVCALIAGCIQDDGSRFNPIDAVVPGLDDDGERQLGLDFDRELQKKVTVIYDPVVAGFVNDLGQAIVKQIEPQPFIYRFRVIRDPSLNAFAVPGGYVYLHSGTLLAVSSVGELAGVMGHEIAHVKAHHYARMKKKTQIPDLLVGMAGIAAAAATGQPGLAVASQAVNVAVSLSYSREFEAEADRLGGVFVTRAGYDPSGITRFFDRIVEEEDRHPNEIPPYLYSHPDVKDRIASVEQEAKSLRPTHPPDPDLRAALNQAQARLALLIDSNRESLPTESSASDSAEVAALLTQADAEAEAGEVATALDLLARARVVAPADPRVSFRVGELLQRQGRQAEAVEAYRTTVRLDPSRALVFFDLGVAYRETGDRHRAVYAFEQAALRAGEPSQLRRRAEWEIEKLTFTVVPEAGFADPARDDGGEAGATSVKQVRLGAPRLVYWARLSPHFVKYADSFTARWIDPTGRVVDDSTVALQRKPYVESVLELHDGGAQPAGTWVVEMRLKDDLIDRRELLVGP